MGYYCQPCDRDFPSRRARNEHFMKSWHHRFDCSRCDIYCHSSASLSQHIEFSWDHHVCQFCGPEVDFPTSTELDWHGEEVHNVCLDCSKVFQSPGKLESHNVRVHNMCTRCGRCFGSLSNLLNHLKSHAPRYVECFGCPRMFNSYSAMVLHLEAGTCRSGASLQTVKHAANYRMSFLYGKYECPDCNVECKHMSGLLQHAESDHSQGLDKFGNFRKFRYHLQVGSFLDTLASDIDDMLDYT